MVLHIAFSDVSVAPESYLHALAMTISLVVSYQLVVPCAIIMRISVMCLC